MILHYAKLMHGRRRRRTCSSSARNCAAWRRSEGPAGPRPARPTARAMRSGTIRSSRGCRRFPTTCDSVFDGAGLTQEPLDAEEPHRLFGRLVELDGLAASGRERPVAASRSALGARRTSTSSSFDNYLPLSDWTTGGGGLDATANWLKPPPSGAWPPSPAAMSGLGLSGVADDLLDALSQGEHRGRREVQLVL